MTKESMKQQIKLAMELFEDEPDGAFWGLVHEYCGLEYGQAFDIIGADPEFFGMQGT